MSSASRNAVAPSFDLPRSPHPPGRPANDAIWERWSADEPAAAAPAEAQSWRPGPGGAGHYHGFATAARACLAAAQAPTDALLVMGSARFTARYFSSEHDRQPRREATLYAADDHAALAFALIGAAPEDALIQIRPESGSA